MAAGKLEHESLAVSYVDNKILITKANLFQKVWNYWNNFLAPRNISLSGALTENRRCST